MLGSTRRLGRVTQRFISTHINPDKPANQQDKLLFTPGPLTTSYTVKKAMLTDLGSRDEAFLRIIKEVDEELIRIAGVSKDEYTSIPIQGSGTFGVESVLTGAVPKSKGFVLIANGSYGLRMHKIAKVHGIGCTMLEYPDNQLPLANDLAAVLSKPEEKERTHVAVVHSETTSGIVNDVEAIGQVAKKFNKRFIVDAMSSFGGIPLDFGKANVDFLVSSANKCIEGVPGFAFVIARRTALAACKGIADTLSLDMFDQRAGLDSNGQFRFTPPTHSLIAFRQALQELKEEGGVSARARRYAENQRVLQEGMVKLGFRLYLPPTLQGYIISSYHYPTDSNWNFNTFYSKLNERGFVIYPGKVSKADCFRIGHIGRIFPSDTKALLRAIDSVCKEMRTAGYAPK